MANSNLSPFKPHSWSKYLYRFHRRRALKSSPKQMALSQVVSLVGTVLSGYLLELNKATLVGFAGAILIMPGVFDLTSSLGAAMSAKMNHALEFNNEPVWKVFWRSVTFSLGEIITAGVLVALIGGVIAASVFGVAGWPVVWLTFGALILTALIGLPTVGYLTLKARQNRVNPDDVIGPVQSSLFEILSMLAIVMLVVAMS